MGLDMKQDELMLGLTIVIFIAIVVNFASQIAHSKDYERCLKEELEFCTHAKLMNHKGCYDYALDRCKEEK